MEQLHSWIIVAMLIFMFSIIPILLFNTETKTKDGESTKSRIRTTHRRTIQFVVAWLFPPTIVILFILKFDMKILGTLFGTFMGYVLTGLGEK